MNESPLIMDEKNSYLVKVSFTSISEIIIDPYGFNENAVILHKLVFPYKRKIIDLH